MGARGVTLDPRFRGGDDTGHRASSRAPRRPPSPHCRASGNPRPAPASPSFPHKREPKRGRLRPAARPSIPRTIAHLRPHPRKSEAAKTGGGSQDACRVYRNFAAPPRTVTARRLRSRALPLRGRATRVPAAWFQEHLQRCGASETRVGCPACTSLAWRPSRTGGPESHPGRRHTPSFPYHTPAPRGRTSGPRAAPGNMPFVARRVTTRLPWESKTTTSVTDFISSREITAISVPSSRSV